ncbi:MAG TPA: hypothetical protein VGV37_26935 [Aliidongia sp.]|uniref:hypothetical protein n=1 Tax=Aliidongia sp. TaxID=1914230 RepID=UPI002DDD087B|nr:hypothetical protein [Aliidongia sp.]HEV2678192.1 hypothetical protein [Aliidongia sp.]
MNKNFGLVLLLGLPVLALVPAVRPADAAQVQARVSDEHGKPVADAVVTLVPADTAVPSPDLVPSRATAVVDQRDETFVPYVVVVAKGGTVVFRNSDKTRHHVYSFSPIKQFEFVLSPGDSSAPVAFDAPGIAAIGCNIHDFMTAFVYVADTPFVAQTDRDGHAMIADLPPGSYSARIWHPLLRPSAALPAQTIQVPDGGAELSSTLSLMAPPHRDHEHGLY